MEINLGKKETHPEESGRGVNQNQLLMRNSLYF